MIKFCKIYQCQRQMALHATSTPMSVYNGIALKLAICYNNGRLTSGLV